jgi:E3 ubiquitin-protein ligase FANCL
VTALTDDLSSLSLRVDDRAGRRHALSLLLPSGYPTSPPCIARSDLPAALDLRWGPGFGLRNVLARFEAAVEFHQELWDSLDDLDANAWVIEPARPTRACAFRRLALGGHASLMVDLDPMSPSAPPLRWQFMGSEAAVVPLRAAMQSRRVEWRTGRCLRANLEAVLGMELPKKEVGVGAAAAEEGLSAECAICYAYRLPPPGSPRAEAAAATAAAAAPVPMDIEDRYDQGEEAGEVPDLNCDNPACSKPFHRRCLAEWLAADTSTRQSFGVLYGTCPYCSSPISVAAEA